MEDDDASQVPSAGQADACRRTWGDIPSRESDPSLHDAGADARLRGDPEEGPPGTRQGQKVFTLVPKSAPTAPPPDLKAGAIEFLKEYLRDVEGDKVNVMGGIVITWLSAHPDDTTALHYWRWNMNQLSHLGLLAIATTATVHET